MRAYKGKLTSQGPKVGHGAVMSAAALWTGT